MNILIRLFPEVLFQGGSSELNEHLAKDYGLP